MRLPTSPPLFGTLFQPPLLYVQRARSPHPAKRSARNRVFRPSPRVGSGSPLGRVFLPGSCPGGLRSSWMLRSQSDLFQVASRPSISFRGPGGLWRRSPRSGSFSAPSVGQSLAALQPAALQDVAAVGGPHAHSESVRLLLVAVIRLVRALHGSQTGLFNLNEALYLRVVGRPAPRRMPDRLARCDT